MCTFSHFHTLAKFIKNFFKNNSEYYFSNALSNTLYKAWI